MEAPDLFLGSYFGAGDCHFSSSENRYFDQKPIDNNAGNQFTIDDLLDFSKEEDEVMIDDAFLHNLNAGPGTGNHSAHSSTVTVTDSCNSSNSAGEPHLSPSGRGHYSSASHFSSNDNELCVPYDDLAELEWLSNFVVEESFSSDELQNLQVSSATKTPSSVVSIRNTTSLPTPIFPSDVSVQGKARSKRSRAAPCNWSSRLLILCPATSSSENNDNNIKKAAEEVEASGQKCLHCGSEKTPQWRTGPMGPKTLCNACGVRYKSGRLLPEYRPAASPTFVSTKHSNSHRKVMELRRQKELQREQEQEQLLSQSSVFGDDYLIHCQNGAAFRHMI